jgi:transcriptional regulator with XRE-family HTH domain
MAASVKVAKGMATTNRLDALRLRLVAGETAKRMGARIRAQRLAKGIRTQRELADLIPEPAVNNQRVSDWERGVHQPSERYLKMLAAALDVDIAYFYGVDEKPETPPLLEVLNGDGDRLGEAIGQLKQLVERQEAVEQALVALTQELAALRRQAQPARRRAS